ncbi:MAG: T9SS type A sorting domain-containing protein [Fibromonadaceae bacterium]|jgi:hypothetical protein|nr:T9SS type A sorting domain-containing protein [Fibromonadaceae bacterium]
MLINTKKCLKLSLLSVATAILQQIVFAQTVALPRIDINTEGNKPITSKVDWTTMTFSLTDPSNPQNNISALDSQQIRGRGNSSWNASWNIITPALPDGTRYRNPYRIRFKKSQQQSPFGLPAARNWVLMNADPDKNSIGLELGKRLELQYTCSYNPVEVYINNGNSGKYIFTEHRQADPAYIGAPGRPKVHLTEGWFIEMDRYYPEDEPIKFHTESYYLPVIVKSPEFENADSLDPRYDFVKNDLNRIADLMSSYDFPENGYRDLVDAETFIKYFLVQTIIQNIDIFRKGTETGNHIGSAFFYKDKGGKIGAGPLWDLNWSFLSGVQGGATMGPNQFPYMVHPWLARFFDDPEFLVRYIEIWNEKMTQIESMRSFIDEIVRKFKTGTELTSSLNSMTSFYDGRLTYLKTEYNKVNARPRIKNFRARGYNYSQVSPSAVTLVSYGEMSNLSASLQKGASSDFEITSNPNQTSTGKGGYLAAVGVKPKSGLAISPLRDSTINVRTNRDTTIKIQQIPYLSPSRDSIIIVKTKHDTTIRIQIPTPYRDTLVLSGTKQGSAFTLKIPLNFVVAATEPPEPPVSLLPQIAATNATATIQIYNVGGKKVTSYISTSSVNNIVSLNHLPPGIYIVKISRGNEHKIMRIAVR